MRPTRPWRLTVSTTLTLLVVLVSLADGQAVSGNVARNGDRHERCPAARRARDNLGPCAHPGAGNDKDGLGRIVSLHDPPARSLHTDVRTGGIPDRPARGHQGRSRADVCCRRRGAGRSGPTGRYGRRWRATHRRQRRPGRAHHRRESRGEPARDPPIQRSVEHVARCH